MEKIFIILSLLSETGIFILENIYGRIKQKYIMIKKTTTNTTFGNYIRELRIKNEIGQRE